MNLRVETLAEIDHAARILHLHEDHAPDPAHVRDIVEEPVPDARAPAPHPRISRAASRKRSASRNHRVAASRLTAAPL